MRKSWIGVAALFAAACAAGPVLAGAAASPADQFAPLGPDDEVVPVVAPGEMIGIACEALSYSAPDNDVRVVLTIAAAPSGAPEPGYKKVLATNEKLTTGAVHVRIPKMPDLANRTVDVNVYVVNALGSHSCNAGHMHITERLKDTAKGEHS
jgi:hypothetical protein